MLAELAERLFGDLNPFEERLRRLTQDRPERMALWPAIAEQGLLGAAFPESGGGFGGTMRDLAVVIGAVGRHLVVEPLTATAISGGLLLSADEDITSIIAGDRLVVLAHDEGLDPFVPRRTTAVRDGEQWRVTGEKVAVRHADIAEQLLVTARNEDGLGERQLSNPTMGLTHNLGGVPYQGVAAISILGLH